MVGRIIRGGKLYAAGGAILLTTVLVSTLSADGPDELLERIRAQVQKHLENLPNYTCRQVIDRVGRPARSARFVHLDRVELDVVFTGKSELFAKTSDGNFQEQPVSSLVPPGTIASTALGSHVDRIFTGDFADFKAAGTAKKDGHKTVRYDFSVTLEKSRFLVRHNSEQAFVAYSGSLWVDAETLELVRADIKADQIPARVGVTLVEESMHYEPMRIGNSDFWLPRRSQLATSDDEGNYTLNDSRLEQCREFTGQSVVTYGAPVPQASRSSEKQN